MAVRSPLAAEPRQRSATLTPHEQQARHLSIEQILAWAEAHFQQTGEWPTDQSGPILGTQGELWHCIDMALWLGERGLPAGTSLEELLAERAGQPVQLTVEHVLAWVDSYYARTGRWPKPSSRRVDGQPKLGWAVIDRALRQGEHGLHGRSSLTLLLRNYRGVTDQRKRSPLAIEQILAWADAHHHQTGRWPNTNSALVIEGDGRKTTWMAIDAALRHGVRGLPGGSSLRRLLAEHRDVPYSDGKPPLTVEQILEWADAHHASTGRWPSKYSGKVGNSDGLTWHSIDSALRTGLRSLPGGSSLAKLLGEHRDPEKLTSRPPLSVEQILAWADAHHAETGQWPRRNSGPVNGAPGETWGGIQHALRWGRRGLPAGSSVAVILREHRGVDNFRHHAPLTVEQILGWVDAHRKRTGNWPNTLSGTIPNGEGITWRTIHCALQRGRRGLPGGSSLRQLLARHRGVPPRKKYKPLAVSNILSWADAHFQATGGWPTAFSGKVQGGDGSSWGTIDDALRQGLRGLEGGTSLQELLMEHRGAPALTEPAPLSEQQVLAWAVNHHHQSGKWPAVDSGPILDAPVDTWHSINEALRRGYRGLPGGSSLVKLVREQRRSANRKGPPPPDMDVDQVLAWADAHHQQTGRWPTMDSGSVLDADGETWVAIDRALRRGSRGLPAGTSLSRLLDEHRR